MKKVIRCLGVMALVALAFASCKKQEQQTTFKASVEDFIIESEDRAYIDDAAKIHFEVGDRMMIFNISNDAPEMSHCATYKAIEDGNHVEFVNSGMGTVGVALDGGYYAYYPATLVQDSLDDWGFVSDRIETELEQGENKSKFFVSPTQTYRPNKVARKDLYLAGSSDAASLADANFRMKSICGIWKLQPFDNAQRTVTKIEIIDNDRALSGWVELVVPAVNAEEMDALCRALANNPTDPTLLGQLADMRNNLQWNVTDAGNKITLNMPEGGVQLAKNYSNNMPAFYIVLRPLALLNGGQVIFTFSNGEVVTKDLTGVNLCMLPNTMRVNAMSFTNLH